MKTFGCLKDDMPVFCLAVNKRTGGDVAMTALPNAHVAKALRIFKANKR